MQSSGGPAISTALLGIGFAAKDLTAYVPVGHRYLGVPPQLATDEALARLKPLLENESLRKHIFESKDAEILLARHGIRLRGIDSDPRIASYVIDPTQDHDLKALCERSTGAAIDDREALCGKGKKATPFESLELERAARFAGCEAEATLALGLQLTAQIRKQPDLKGLFDEVEMPLSHVLAVIERHGVCLDVPMMRTLSADVETRLHA